MVQEDTNKVHEFAVSKDNVIGKEGLNIKGFKGAETKISEVKLNAFNLGTAEERFAFKIITEEIDVDGTKVNCVEYISCWRDKEEFNQPVTANSKFYWSLSDNSNAQRMLNYFDVTHPMDLVGQTCQVVRKVNDSGKEKLGIMYGK